MFQPELMHITSLRSHLILPRYMYGF
jgi:hypothetical protein